MTGFIIFAIVLTLAYVLYFAAMITTDLAAMKKAAETEEENIDIGTGSEEVDEFATQNVVEDPSTGGFNFVTPQQKEAEASEEIVEAEEDENDDDPSASLRNRLMHHPLHVSVMRNLSPPPSAVSAVIVPPCSITAFLTMASPSPVPPFLRLLPLSTL